MFNKLFCKHEYKLIERFELNNCNFNLLECKKCGKRKYIFVCSKKPHSYLVELAKGWVCGLYDIKTIAFILDEEDFETYKRSLV